MVCGVSESTEGWRRKDAGTSLNPLCDKTQAPQGRNSGHPKLKGDPLGTVRGSWGAGLRVLLGFFLHREWKQIGLLDCAQKRALQ